MQLPVARLNDTTHGVCSEHGPIKGKIITSSSTTLINNRGVARIGDTVQADCGHTGIIITGSDAFIENKQLRNIARVSSKFEGIYSGIVISGSPDTLTS